MNQLKFNFTNKIKRLNHHIKMQTSAPMQSELFSQFSYNEITEYRQLFSTIDPNNDGYITCKQLKNYLRDSLQHVGEEEIREIINEADKSGCGHITFGNFIELIQDRERKEKRNQIKLVFDSFDLNRDGFIDLTDMSTVFFSLNSGDENQIQAIFKKLDINNDGKIDFEEFESFTEICTDLSR